MSLHSQFIRGALAYYDTYRHRIVDAIGANVVKYVDDFVATPHASGVPSQFTITQVGTNAIVLAGGSGGFLSVTTPASENSGANLQALPAAFELTSDQHLYFGAFGIAIDDVTQSDLFLGLAVVDTDILGGVTDRVGFQSVDGDAGLDFAIEKDSTETLDEDVHTMVDATAFDAEFFYDGAKGTLRHYINGVEVAASAITNLPNDVALAPSLQFLAGADAAKALTIDAIRVIQIGR